MFEPLASIPWFNRCQIRACDHGTTRPVHVDKRLAQDSRL